MIVNIALLTVTDTRTIDNDKSGAILVDKIAQANHKLIERKICKDNKVDILLIQFSYAIGKFNKNEKSKREQLHQYIFPRRQNIHPIRDTRSPHGI